MGYAGLPFDANVFVDFKTRCDTFADPEDICFTRHKGDIVIYADDDDYHENPITAGTIRALVVNFAEGVDAGCPLSEIFDFEEGLDALYDALTELDGNNFKGSLFEGYGFGNWSSLLIIERVEIKPEHRGRGLGLLACETTCRHIGSGCDMAAIQVCPLQFESSYRNGKGTDSERLALKGFSSNEAAATERLKSHYMMMGFKELTSNIIVRSPNPF